MTLLYCIRNISVITSCTCTHHIMCAISSPDCSTMVRKAFCCCCCCSGDRERRAALHSCCRREVGSRGCEERWKCCSMRRWGGDRAEDIAGATSVRENGAAVRVGAGAGGCRRRWACCRTDVEGEFDSLSIRALARRIIIAAREACFRLPGRGRLPTFLQLLPRSAGFPGLRGRV